MDLNISKSKNLFLTGMISILMISSVNFANATNKVSVTDSDLTSGYSIYKDLSDMQYPTIVSYWDSLIKELKSNKDCTSNILNIWNNSEEFYFSQCWFSVSKTDFNTNRHLLNLWQAGREDIKETIPNKLKFAMYSNLFQGLKNTYAYNIWYTKYERTENLGDLNISYRENSEKLKKSFIAAYILNPKSWMTAISEIVSEWEMAPIHYFTDAQYKKYNTFSVSTLALMEKIWKIKDKKTINKLKIALEKELKDSKKKTNNDSFLKLMLIYQIVLEKK